VAKATLEKELEGDTGKHAKGSHVNIPGLLQNGRKQIIATFAT
jgi:hypothetical protein